MGTAEVRDGLLEAARERRPLSPSCGPLKNERLFSRSDRLAELAREVQRETSDLTSANKTSTATYR